ncbi:MAG: hypothetical protein GW892_15860 [Armatimonadetes bacterium]|nr:hypothetical protein [Armatimonadota bacterium]
MHPSPFALNSGAYLAEPVVGSARNPPPVSAQLRRASRLPATSGQPRTVTSGLPRGPCVPP